MGIRDWRRRRLVRTEKLDPQNDLKHLQAALDRGGPDRRSEEVPPAEAVRQTGVIGRLAEVVGQFQQQDDQRQNQETRDILSQIAVVAFVGPSGTGKSTRAIRIARKNQIQYIIDDGLLIHGSRIVAGTSAKKAGTRLESVRQALFLDPTRSANMRRALAEHRPPTLMILGTSDSMLSKICNNLWLNQPAMLIRIEDVTTEEERQIAKRTRMTAGQHTIPVPSMEIKHEFSGYFSDPMGRLRRRFERERGINSVNFGTERTVVRPTFSSLGNYSISDEAMEHMTRLIAEGVSGVDEMIGFRLQKEKTGVVLYLELALLYGRNAEEALQTTQTRVSRQIEEYTSISVLAVNVIARRVVIASRTRKAT